MAKTLFEKIWDRHVIATEEGDSLLYIDRAVIHEGSSHAFDTIREQKRAVFRPQQIFAFNDHYVPTSGRSKGVNGIAVPEIRNMVLQLEANAKEHRITHFGIDHPQQIEPQASTSLEPFEWPQALPVGGARYADDAGALAVPLPAAADVIGYSATVPGGTPNAGVTSARLIAEALVLDASGSRFDVRFDGRTLGSVTLAVPGVHNVRNALAAIA